MKQFLVLLVVTLGKEHFWTRPISLWKPKVREVDQYGHGECLIVVETASCCFSCNVINVYVPCQVACDGNGNAKYLHLAYSLNVCSVDTYGWEVCPCFREINNKLFCLIFVDFHVILDFPQVRCISCFLASWRLGV